MDKEQKKYMIKKCEKYSAEWQDNNQKIRDSFFIGVISLITAVYSSFSYHEILTVIGSSNLGYTSAKALSLIFGSSAATVLSIKSLVDKIKNKTYIEKKIDRINFMIDQDDEAKNNRGGR